MKLYNWVAIVGFLLCLLGCVIRLNSFVIAGIGMIILMVPFNINDNLKRDND